MESKLTAAREHYAKAKAIIEELSNLALETNSKFKFSIAMRQFDYILQLSLIYAAVTDDDFKKVELDFIKDITEYGSVVSLFNIKAEDIAPNLPDLTWENLIPLRKALSVKGKQAFMDQITVFVDGITVDFIKWFAPIDAKSTKINYINRISAVFDDIITLFSFCDDEADTAGATAEQESAKKVKKSILVSKWKKAVEETT